MSKYFVKIIGYIFACSFLYIVIPLSLSVFGWHNQLKALFLFYLVNLLFVAYFFKRNSVRKYYLACQIQSTQEEINILNNELTQKIKNKSALAEKITRYHSLKKNIDQINKNFSLESVADNLVSIVFSQVAKNQGTCLLYLLDSATQSSPVLFKVKKENKLLIIRAKEGDIFDSWILRHCSPLFIEDIKKDFRFDVGQLRIQESRPIASLISSPLVSENKFLGILRLDHYRAGFYSQDDLRFLATVCDIGAVALENSGLFKKTQDLAIHDELTSFYTKGYFLERLKEECKRSVRQNRLLALLMLDIDHFKNYNDKFGHPSGDMVLRMLGCKITEVLKEFSPVISRFGGEEFCVILTALDKKKVALIAEELRFEIEKTKIDLRRQQASVSVSIGVAFFPEDIRDEDELIIKADKAMYEAKQKGRNRVCGI